MSEEREQREIKERLTAEDPLVNDRSYWEAVEAVSEGLPQLDVVTSLACDERERRAVSIDRIHERNFACFLIDLKITPNSSPTTRTRRGE